MINSFSGPYEFLSNFYNCPVTAWGITYRNSESAFQAQKTKDEEIRKEFSNLNPSQGKLRGRNIELREDWEEIKDSVMYHILRYKFYQNKNLFVKLMQTEDEELIEFSDVDYDEDTTEDFGSETKTDLCEDSK